MMLAALALVAWCWCGDSLAAAQSGTSLPAIRTRRSGPIGDATVTVGASQASTEERYRPWPGEGDPRDTEKSHSGRAGGVSGSIGMALGEHVVLSGFARLDLYGTFHFTYGRGVRPTAAFQLGPQITLSQRLLDGVYLQLRGGLAAANGRGYQVGADLGYGFACRRRACFGVAASFTFIRTKDHVEGSFGDYYYVERAINPGLALRLRFVPSWYRPAGSTGTSVSSSAS